VLPAGSRWASWALSAALLTGCTSSSPPSNPTPTAQSAASAAPPPAPSPSPPPAAPTAAPASAEAPKDSAPADAGAPFAADNKVDPTEGPELQERAKALFEAIMANDAEHADPFWFPKEPFIPLKDIKDPGKYWDQLHRTYAADIRALHKKRKSWDGASFVSFAIGSKPKWVKPGDEANKIGYYRSFHGTLRYAIDGKEGTLDVHTVITWQGRWYITHLRKFKK
jgi:hypothetical protein